MPQYHTYYPNYEKLYPGIEKRPDILRVLRASDRKMRYMEWQLQTERFVEDQEKQIAVFLPSRETSLEQMDEEKHQFVDERPGPEEQLTQSEKLQLLRRALKSLTSAEREVIQSLYFEDLTERRYPNSRRSAKDNQWTASGEQLQTEKILQINSGRAGAVYHRPLPFT